MKKMRYLLLFVIIVLITTGLLGCSKTEIPSAQAAGASAAQPEEEKPVSLTISAAASLKDAMEEIKQQYGKEKPNVTITYNFGSSGSLQQQIEQGAPVDIFMPAAAKQMNVLKEKNLIIEETNKNLLENKVVLIAPKDSSLLKEFTDLADDRVKKIALGEPKSVPVGQYSEEILISMKIKEKVQPKAVFARDVREVLTWVETGNADAGIVYETDAKVSDKVKVVASAPENSHKPVVYPVAVIKSSQNIDAAKEFLQFISGDKGKAVFEKFGFHMTK